MEIDFLRIIILEKKQNPATKKALIIRLTSLGDVIFTLPLASILKKNGYEVSYLTSEKGINVIQNNPLVDKIHFCPLAKWRKNRFKLGTFLEFLSLIEELKFEKYDIAIDCQQMFKSLLLFLFCGAKRRITFKDAKELSNLGGNEFVIPTHKFKDPNYHIVNRNLEFATHLGITPETPEFSLPPTQEDTKHKVNLLLKNYDNNKKLIVLAPQTTWKYKHWQEGNWSELIQKLVKNPQYQVVLTSDRHGMDIIDRICSVLTGEEKRKIINLSGKTELSELTEILKRADLVITVDSGTAHLSWAGGHAGIISIFTCTPPLRFAPFGKNIYKFLPEKPSCKQCFSRKCKLNSQKGLCTQSPSAQEVFDNVEKILTNVD